MLQETAAIEDNDNIHQKEVKKSESKKSLREKVSIITSFFFGPRDAYN